MKKATVLFLLLFISLSGFSQSSPSFDCKEKSIGKWEYYGLSKDTLYAVQTLTKHLEMANNGTCEYQFDIHWMNDCKYELIYKGTTCERPAVSNVGEKTIVEIINLKSDTLFYHTTFRDMEEYGKMIKLK